MLIGMVKGTVQSTKRYPTWREIRFIAGDGDLGKIDVATCKTIEKSL